MLGIKSKPAAYANTSGAQTTRFKPEAAAPGAAFSTEGRAAPGKRAMRTRRAACGSEQTVGAWGQKFEEAEAAEDLELLPDFGLDVMIVRVEFREFLFFFVDFLEREFLFVKSFDDLQDV